MDFPIHIKTDKDGFIHYISEGSHIRISKVICTSVPEECVSKGNSVNPDDLPHYVAFHLSLHCLPIKLFVCCQTKKS